MKTYEEFETPSYIYRRIGRPGEVHHVRHNKWQRKGTWADVSARTYERVRGGHSNTVTQKNPEPANTDSPTLESFEGNNGRVYRKVIRSVRGRRKVYYQSRPKGSGPVRWVTIGKQRYDTMKMVTVGQSYGGVCAPSARASIEITDEAHMPMTETPQGRSIRRSTRRLEERLAASNDRAQQDRDAFLEVSNEFTKVEASRDAAMRANQVLEETVNLVRTQRDNLQVTLNIQPHRIKNAEYAQNQAEERLGEVARECSSLKQDISSLTSLLKMAELGRNHAEEQARKHQSALDVANARWKAFVDRVVNPPIFEHEEELKRENRELRKNNKRLLNSPWQARAEALRRMLKKQRGASRVLAWNSVDKYVEKMEGPNDY